MISKRDDQMRRPAGLRKCQSGNKLGIERVSSKASVDKQVTYAEAPNAGSGEVFMVTRLRETCHTKYRGFLMRALR